ncbi:Lem3/Cdc50 [Ramicandelaber brevisporus]|nr:Lem3/Cdc50 [Ramicandelaber brevisporus]
MATDKYNVRVPGTAASAPRWKYDNDASTCSIEFAVPSDLKPPVFMYYQLTNFYQNHRVYVKSYDAAQLRGDDVDYEKLKYCKPLNKLEDVQDGGKVKPIYPCGLIANSIFNDTIHNPVFRNPPASNVQNMVYEFSPKGIAWKSDLEKFGKSNYKPNDVVPPPSWLARYPQGYNETNFPKLNEDERFIVWMRAAGLPTFRKLYGRNDNNAMLAGVYSMDIDMNFDTTGYGGTKSFVISTSSFMGGRNPALGISYIVVGALCVILGLIFTTRYIRHPRKLGDHTQLSWNGGGHHH